VGKDRLNFNLLNLPKGCDPPRQSVWDPRAGLQPLPRRSWSVFFSGTLDIAQKTKKQQVEAGFMGFINFLNFLNDITTELLMSAAGL